MFEHIQPIVLVGGRARRFGRDKLREPVDAIANEWLVDRSIAALRAVFGPRVAAVGECAPEVAARFDLVIADAHPGIGPLGGVLSALKHTDQDLFVLAGDLSAIRSDDVRTILAAAERAPDALAVLAESNGLQPCIGLYRRGAKACLEAAFARGDLALHATIPQANLIVVPIGAAHVLNVNTPGDLPNIQK